MDKNNTNKKTKESEVQEIRKKKPGERWANLGCGSWVRKDFYNIDNYVDFEALKEGVRTKKGVYQNGIYDDGGICIKADIKNMPFDDNYFDYCEAMNVIEHFPLHDILSYLKEIYRVMKKGGNLIILTNNFDGLFANWMTMIANPPIDMTEYITIAEEIFGNQVGGEGETHKCPFNPAFLNEVLVQAGFKNGTIGILKKNDPVPVIGTVEPLHKDAVCRNDLLVAEVTK